MPPSPIGGRHSDARDGTAVDGHLIDTDEPGHDLPHITHPFRRFDDRVPALPAADGGAGHHAGPRARRGVPRRHRPSRGTGRHRTAPTRWRGTSRKESLTAVTRRVRYAAPVMVETDCDDDTTGRSAPLPWSAR